jgi:hypothetical protein
MLVRIGMVERRLPGTASFTVVFVLESFIYTYWNGEVFYAVFIFPPHLTLLQFH